MQSNNSSSSPVRRTRLAVAAILALGAVAAILILRSGGPDARAQESPAHTHAAGHADEEHHGSAAAGTHAHADGHADGEHHGDEKPGQAASAGAHDDDDEGLVRLSAERARSAGVELAQAQAATVNSMLQLPGEIRFNEDRTAHVVPRVVGVAESVSANLGQSVKKGQLLAVLSSVAVSEQRSELLAAQKRLELARTTFAREKQLWEEKVSAEQDYLQARQAMGEAEIAVSNARQKLAATGAGAGAGGGLNRFELRAPFDGVVVEKHLAVGESVQEATQVFTISDLSTVWAEMRVAASDLPAVRVGEKATVRATAFDSSAQGEIAYVGALIGQETRTAPARITLANPQGLWRPGLFVNVELTASSQQVPLAVASEAVQRLEGQQAVVFVPVGQGFRAQSVRPGRTDGIHTEILEGLDSGQSYVAKGSFVLKAELGKASAEHTH
ncbi:efflux RND transporter periplasmic adaptor subunit [Comamonas composti]|uniref:efflux RND transporter periplasmic adaptor subunit n=1 Tax=Comamonas composti TaxID=408558 RepID=UPI00040E1B5A|nr:efflux RND transporter periplasmic adaptor subunit [Comamonas composti]